jgi:hypothetical protein
MAGAGLGECPNRRPIHVKKRRRITAGVKFSSRQFEDTRDSYLATQLTKLCLTRKSGFNDVITDGVSNQPCHGMAVDFLHDVGAMGIRRLYGYSQDNSDFLTAVPFGYELYNFPLPIRQPQVHVLDNIALYLVNPS